MDVVRITSTSANTNYVCVLSDSVLGNQEWPLPKNRDSQWPVKANGWSHARSNLDWINAVVLADVGRPLGAPMNVHP